MQFNTKNNFRHVLAFSLLAGKNVTINSDEPFEDYELNFLNLLSLITKNTKVFISNKNRTVNFKPGTIEMDSKSESTFDCGSTRAISYYIEPLVFIGLYSKEQLSLSLAGITNESIDLSIDTIKDALFPFLKACYPDHFDGEIKIIERGFRPSGKGLVQFTVKSVKRTLSSITLTPHKNLVKRIRGIAIASKTSSQFLGQMISKMRQIFNDYIPDVWVYSLLVKNSTDHFYGVSLHTNTYLVSEYCYDALTDPKKRPSPEQVAEQACLRLLDEIMFSSNLISTSFQSFLFVFMALADGKLSSVNVGRVSEHSIGVIRLLKQFFNVEFEFKDVVQGQENDRSVTARCVGAGLLNRTSELA
jgi:RNA 3'-terminal phosphate cyclase-like protein